MERGQALLGYVPIGDVGMILLATRLRVAAILPGGHQARLVAESKWLHIPLQVGIFSSFPQLATRVGAGFRAPQEYEGDLLHARTSPTLSSGILTKSMPGGSLAKSTPPISISGGTNPTIPEESDSNQPDCKLSNSKTTVWLSHDCRNPGKCYF